MRRRFAAALVLVAALSATAGHARPIPPQPDYCTTQFHRGPVATSCPFNYGGGRVWVFGQALATEAPAGITIEVVLVQGTGEQVLLSCSGAADRFGSVALPTARCTGRSTQLPLDVGTELRCRHRGPGEGVFGCLST